MPAAPAIIDCHTHAFPAAAVADPAKWALEQQEPYWQSLVESGHRKPSLQGWVTQDEFIAAMDRDMIRQAVLLGWYWENPESCRIHNDEMLLWIQSFPNRFRALACVHPEGPAPTDLVSWAVEKGFSGFGELFPAIQGSRLDQPFWNELAALSSEAGLLFNFHVSEPVGRPHPGRTPTPFDELQGFILRHPDLRIILSHWGGGLFLHELNPFVRRAFRNVFYDCAANPLLYDTEIFPIACQTIDPGKILFGSDFPLRLYPAREREPGWSLFIDEIRARKLKDEDETRIFRGNAQALFGFDP